MSRACTVNRTIWTAMRDLLCSGYLYSLIYLSYTQLDLKQSLAELRQLRRIPPSAGVRGGDEGDHDEPHIHIG